MGRIVGIDFGTKHSRLAVMDGGGPVVIPNREGERATLSVVAFAPSGEILVGSSARRQATGNPRGTVHHIKRLMGRRYDAPATRDLARELPYELVRSASGGVLVRVGDNLYSPPEIAAILFGELKAAAEAYLGETVERAVVCVPCYFDATRRRSVRDAASIAGFDVEGVLDEPTAAALWHGLEPASNDRVVICDLGAGHFSLSIVRGDGDSLRVLATDGDASLGGIDFDRCIVNWLIDWFQGAYGIDLMEDPVALQRLREAAEKAKQELSVQSQTKITLPFVSAQHGDKRIETTLSRSSFEQMIAPLLERVAPLCEESLQRAGVDALDIEVVRGLGLQAKLPAFVERMRGVFGQDFRWEAHEDPSVCLGAALQGGRIGSGGRASVLKDVTPRSLGIETAEGGFTAVVERNAPVPVTRHVNLSTLPTHGRDVEIQVLEGESLVASENISLARFVLGDVVPESDQKPTVQITFEIDANGALSVSAYEPWTSREQSFDVVPRGQLSDDSLQLARKKHEQYRRIASREPTLDSSFAPFARLVDETTKSLDRWSDRLTREELLKCYEALAVAAAVLKRADDAALPAVTKRVEQIAETLEQARLR